MIRLFLTDLDGCLTDGTYFTFSDQEGIIKQFNTRDFYGIRLLQQTYKIPSVIVTLSRGEVAKKHIERLKDLVDIKIMTKVEDKYAAIYKNYVSNMKYSWKEIAFIGDDLNDIELLQAVGFAACPADAEPEVLKTIEDHKDGYVCARNGGKGCVREFTDLIRSSV